VFWFLSELAMVESIGDPSASEGFIGTDHVRDEALKIMKKAALLSQH
jgi:hypothetical protein